MNEPSDIAVFEVHLENIRQNKEFSELPGLGISMWPEDIAFQDDLSDSHYYNEIFIEQRRDKASGLRFYMKILFFFHNPESVRPPL